MTVLLSLALLAAPPPAPPAPAAKPHLTVTEVVAKVASANAALSTWSCRFVERRHFVHFNETETRGGRIRIKRGQGLRLDIEGEDEETIVVARDRALQWRPRTRQLHIYKLDPSGKGKSDLSPVPFAFGATGWDPARDYEMKLLDNPDPEIALELVPKSEDATYVRKVLWIDPRSWLPVRLQLVESTDDVIHFAFSEIELGGKLDDDLFDLKPPAGADVVEHSDLPSF